MHIAYINKSFSTKSMVTIDQANTIIDKYRADGFILTLRQLYYQFVSRDLIPNQQTEYKRLGSIINDGRLAGLIDWSAIEDRTRNLKNLSHWDSPRDIIDSAVHSYRRDHWEGQSNYVEIWCEKEALSGIFEQAANRWDVPHFSCRGYVSQSEMWRAAIRLIGMIDEGRDVYILYFGDLDPSGIDMDRDIYERLNLFGCPATVERMALTSPQITQYDPPPNPAKITDSRCKAYIQIYGHDSWELDALEPMVLSDIVENRIRSLIDQDQWDEIISKEQGEKYWLRSTAESWKEAE